MDLIDHALSNGVVVSAWTFDELYGRDGKFLTGLDSRGQVFVGEIPTDFHGWVWKPTSRPKRAGNSAKQDRKGKSRRRPRTSEVRNLLRYSPVFREQSWQPYRIKDTDGGPEVWEVKWAKFWRKGPDGSPTRRHCLLVARNVLTKEVKYFLSNRLPGEKNPVTGQYVTLRWLLRVAFGRWSIESCFRQAKEELGLDHYEVRGWRCVHRHFHVTQLSHLFCARVRQEYDTASGNHVDRITVEQVRSAMNAWLDSVDLPHRVRRQRLVAELEKQQYYQRRNKQARKSKTRTKRTQLNRIGIDPDQIKSCLRGPDKE